MEFGKLPSVDAIDFTLPDDHPRTAALLAAARPDRPHHTFRLGTAGWSDKRLVGKLYPWGAKPGAFLRHYARTFATNELNTTYYGVDPGRLRAWTEAVDPGFRFCPKFPAAISHEAELVDCAPAIDRFLDALDALGPNLGIPWLVLPPAFGPERDRVLARFLDTVDQRVRLAIELRHPDWFTNSRAAEAGFALLEEHNAVAVLTDVAGRRDVLHQRLTTSTVFLRFVGNGGHPTDTTRLAAWVDRLERWVAQGLRETWLFLHQPEDHHTVELAEFLIPRVNAHLGADLAPLVRPDPLPEQGSLF